MGVMDRLSKPSEPKPEPKVDPDPNAKRTRPKASAPKPEPKPDAIEIDIETALSELSDEERAALIAEIVGDVPGDPFSASLTATRETKVGGIQFDGKTSTGIQVRVWTPAGMGDLPVEVRLVTAEAKADGQA